MGLHVQNNELLASMENVIKSLQAAARDRFGVSATTESTLEQMGKIRKELLESRVEQMLRMKKSGDMAKARALATEIVRIANALDFSIARVEPPKQGELFSVSQEPKSNAYDI